MYLIYLLYLSYAQQIMRHGYGMVVVINKLLQNCASAVSYVAATAVYDGVSCCRRLEAIVKQKRKKQ